MLAWLALIRSLDHSLTHPRALGNKAYTDIVYELNASILETLYAQWPGSVFYHVTGSVGHVIHSDVMRTHPRRTEEWM